MQMMKFLSGLRACPYDFGCWTLVYSNVCYDVGVLCVKREWMGTLGVKNSLSLACAYVYKFFCCKCG